MTAERLTESQHLEQRITQALVTIRREWDAMMPKGPAAARPSMGGSGTAAGIVGDSSAPWLDDLGRPHWRTDHARGGGDVDPTTRLLSLRREVAEVLNGWCRVVIEDRPVTKALPSDGMDAIVLAVFLERHASWMAEHEAALDCADEVEHLARQVEGVASPKVKQWVGLGSCPLKIEQEVDGRLVMVVCGGQVRAWPKPGDRDGEVMARCRRCGIEAVTSWWEARMFDNPELKVLLTAEEVVGFVHRAYGKVIKAATVRQWDKRGTIEPAGHDDKGRRLYARDALVWALDLQERREAMGL